MRIVALEVRFRGRSGGLSLCRSDSEGGLKDCGSGGQIVRDVCRIFVVEAHSEECLQDCSFGSQILRNVFRIVALDVRF